MGLMNTAMSSGVLGAALVVMIIMSCLVSLSVQDDAIFSKGGASKQLVVQAEKMFEKRVELTRKICSMLAKRLSQQVKSFKHPFVVDNTNYELPIGRKNCTSRQDVLRSYRHMITRQYTTLLAYEYQLDDCIEKNTRINARLHVQNSITLMLSRLVRYNDIGLYVIRLNMKLMTRAFALQDDAVVRSTMSYCNASISPQDFTERLVAVLHGLDDFLKGMLTTSVVVYRTRCGRRRIPSDELPVDTTTARRARTAELVIIVFASVIILVVIICLVMYLRRTGATKKKIFDKACQAVITNGGLFTDIGVDERGEHERHSENDCEMNTGVDERDDITR